MSGIMAEYSARRPDLAKQVAAWLNSLARLVRRAPGDGEGEQIALYVEMLLPELPPAAFNNRALRYIADGCEWWPAYAALLGRLREHWESEKYRRSQERVLQIAGPAPLGELKGADATWANLYHRRCASGWAHGNEMLSDEREREGRRNRCLDMMRRHAPDAYRAVTGRLSNPPPDHSSWSDVHALRKTLAEIDVSTVVGKALAAAAWAAVMRHAPHNAGICEEMIGPKPNEGRKKKRDLAA